MDVWFDESTSLYWEVPSRFEKNCEHKLETLSKYVDELNRMRFGGFEDWRIPTLEELLTLSSIPFYDYTQHPNRQENFTLWKEFKEGQEYQEFFIAEPLQSSTGKNGWYWSCTPKKDTLEYYLVNFKDANINSHLPNQEFYVRCVRNQ